MKTIAIIVIAIGLSSCSDNEWYCKTQGQSMFSMSSSGEIGGAGKGCSCSEIRAFELRTFGEVDEDALKSDFGC
jgi:hypothetical protein